jgi:hypothetical protein
MKGQGLYLNDVYGGGYYYNTMIDKTNHATSDANTGYCFR